MHLTNENLKILIDVLAERLDDDLDMLSDSNFMEEREGVKMAWAVKDLLEGLRQEQRSRGRAPAGAANVAIGVVQATMGDHEAELKDQQDQLNDIRSALAKLWGRVRKLEALVSDHEESRMEHHTRLEDHHAKLEGSDFEVLSGLQERLEALELASDDRWVRTQQMVSMGGQRLGELENQLSVHCGEGEVRH